MAKHIFDGIKVLDMGTGATIPLQTKWLGAHGATVVKVESHLRLDAARMGGPFFKFVPGLDRGGWHIWLNANKCSMTVNLSKPQGVELIKKLISKWQPNVLAESYRPGVMKKWGLDYESVRQLKPDIIYYSTCIEGQTGPHNMRLGYGQLTSSLCGVNYLTGWPDRPPAGLAMAYGDYTAAGLGITALMGALMRQRRTGRGVYIDQAQYESNLYVLAAPIMDYTVNHRVMNRNGNRLSYAAPHGVFPCQGTDRWVAIAVMSDTDWRAFCQAIGSPDWTRDAAFSTLAGRKENEDRLEGLVAAWTATLTAEEVEARMQAAGVAANVVEDNKDIFEDPQMRHRGQFPEVDHPELGRIHSQTAPFKLSKSPERHTVAPLLGEHNQKVLSELVGLTDDEIGDLYAAGVITTEADLPAPKKK